MSLKKINNDDAMNKNKSNNGKFNFINHNRKKSRRINYNKKFYSINYNRKVSVGYASKPFFIFILTFLIVLLSINYVSAYKRLCLGYGQSIPNSQDPIYTCWHDSCQICVSDNNYPTHPARCNDLVGCQTLGDAEVDVDPPDLTINSPQEDQVFSSRMVLFDLESDEPSSYYYKTSRGSWKRLSANSKSYFREISFKDGLNEITIKAVDRNLNSVEYLVSFYVDSKKPKILRTYPKEEFANGDFAIQFREDNPERVTLNYGVIGNIKTRDLDLDDCLYEKSKYTCDISVDISEFDGQFIKYWFEVEDIAERVIESRQTFFEVDVTPPKILNEDFWTQGLLGILRTNKYIYFDLLIDEENFEKVFYIDNSQDRPREKTLCSSLKNGRCYKKVTFRRGNHEVDVQVVDKAGNSIAQRIEFDVL